MAHTEAEYVCADQLVIFTFCLQRSGGPYIPIGFSGSVLVLWLLEAEEMDMAALVPGDE
jgi:hypothetical protein